MSLRVRYWVLFCFFFIQTPVSYLHHSRGHWAWCSSVVLSNPYPLSWPSFFVRHMHVTGPVVVVRVCPQCVGECCPCDGSGRSRRDTETAGQHRTRVGSVSTCCNAGSRLCHSEDKGTFLEKSSTCIRNKRGPVLRFYRNLLLPILKTLCLFIIPQY